MIKHAGKAGIPEAGAAKGGVAAVHRAVAVPRPVAILRGRAPDPLAQRIARLGAVVAALSGIVLFLCRGGVYLGNAEFQIKLALLALALANVVAAHRVQGEAGRRATAAASLVFWLSVVLAGR